MPEQLLVKQAIKGDVQAFGKLVEKYSKMCFSIAFKVLKDYDDANDITQDAFIAAYEHISKFKEESKFSTWLYRIVFNKAIAHKKKIGFNFEIQEKNISEVADNEEEIETNDVSPKILKEALQSLNDSERMIIDFVLLSRTVD